MRLDCTILGIPERSSSPRGYRNPLFAIGKRGKATLALSKTAIYLRHSGGLCFIGFENWLGWHRMKSRPWGRIRRLLLCMNPTLNGRFRRSAASRLLRNEFGDPGRHELHWIKLTRPSLHDGSPIVQLAAFARDWIAVHPAVGNR